MVDEGNKDSSGSAFKEWVDANEVEKKLGKPIVGTDLHTPIVESKSLPDDTPEWVRDLVKMSEADPKMYQLRFLSMELSARVEKGSLLRDGEDPGVFIDKAEDLEPEDYRKSWYLRQATTEYLVRAAEGDEDAEKRAKVLIKGILGDDEVLTEDVYPKLIVGVRKD